MWSAEEDVVLRCHSINYTRERDMNTKKLVRGAAIVVILAGAFVVGNSAASTLTAGELVPDCDCTVHNWPNPGDEKPGVRVDGECFLDPCATEIETE
jgi:hypothetical protein